MATIPGWDRAAAFAAKMDAQLAVHGEDFQYVPKRGPNYTIRACQGEGVQEGKRVFFTLWARPSTFTEEPKPGDSVLVGDRWYVVERTTLESGWRILLCHFQRYA